MNPQRQEQMEVVPSPFLSARMRQSLLISFAIAMLFQSGCSVYHLTKRTLHCELNEYPQMTDAKQACRQYQRWAKEEWHHASSEFDGPPSRDYASGFLQGFVDQVYAGGDTIAPPIPPRKYWRVSYRNAHGRRAIEDWYHGFEHGAEVAQEGGYRDRAVVPSSLIAGSGEDLRLREGFDGEPVIVPDEQDAEEIPTPMQLSMDNFPNANEEEEAPAAILPIAFVTAEPIKEIVPESTWGDHPPRPPWHLASFETDPSESPETFPPVTDPATSDSVEQRPTEAGSSGQSSPNVNDDQVGTGLQLNAPRLGEEEEGPFREMPSTTAPSAATVHPQPTPAGPPSNEVELETEDASRQESISEPTLWQSRD